MTIRDHQPTLLSEFNGLWQRGDPNNTPLDHFQDCENLKFIGTNDFGTRDGVGIHQSVAVPLKSILRIYNYPTSTANTLIVLARNSVGDGEIYHIVNSATIHGPLLTITGMVDFGFLPYAGRAYITPIGYFTHGDLNIEKGIDNEFLYVYKGDGTAARKAAGATPAGTVTVANGAAGNTDAGIHNFAVVGETDTGYLSKPIGFRKFTTSAALSVSFSTVPTFVGAQWTKRHIVATKVIKNDTGDLTGYQYFFIPNATINDNTTTTLSNISFFDADLLEDASHLLDNFGEIPAGVGLALYHNRLCIFATFDDISLAYVSEPGEPEAINQVDGILIVPPDGNPITNAQELRDIFYVFKRSRTVGFVDNGDIPSTWKMVSIDNSLGCPIHGIATVLDSGASSVDYLIVATYQGINIFNGRYAIPELSWKVENFWRGLDRDFFRKVQILHAPIQKEILTVLPDNRILVGNYTNGLDPKKIKWIPWSFFITVNSIAIVNIDEIILGADYV